MVILSLYNLFFYPFSSSTNHWARMGIFSFPSLMYETVFYLLWTRSYRHWETINKMINNYKPKEKEDKEFDIIKHGGKTPRNTSTSALFNSPRLIIKRRQRNYNDILNDDKSLAMIGLRMELEYKPLEKRTKAELKVMIDDAIRRVLGQNYGFLDDGRVVRDDLLEADEGMNELIWCAGHAEHYNDLFNEEAWKYEIERYRFCFYKTAKEVVEVLHKEYEETYSMLWDLAHVLKKMLIPYLTIDEIKDCFNLSEHTILNVEDMLPFYMPNLWDAERLYHISFPGGTLSLTGYETNDEEIIEYLEKRIQRLREDEEIFEDWDEYRFACIIELLTDFPWENEENKAKGEQLTEQLKHQVEEGLERLKLKAEDQS